METLAAYDPRIAGTPPLGVETETSDIDILCHVPDASDFLTDVQNAYGTMSGLRIWQWIANDRSLIVTFHAHGWDFEIFASPQPVASQSGWRHFEIERRLLSIGGEEFRQAIKQLRQKGMKTEPAFWSALNEVGDPYRGLLSLEAASDDTLRNKLAGLGFGLDTSASNA